MGQHQSKDELLYQLVNFSSVKGIKALRKDGAGLEWIDKEGKTPLIAACMDPKLYDVAKTLIKLGANVNAYRPGRRAGTPLHHAAERGLWRTVILLLSNGANALVMNDEYQTPLDIAKSKGDSNVISIIESHLRGWIRGIYGPDFPELLGSQELWLAVLHPGPKNLLMEEDTQPCIIVTLWKLFKNALKVALAPTPGKPHSVDDNCFKLKKAVEAKTVSALSGRGTSSIRKLDCSTRLDTGKARSSKVPLSTTMEPIKYHEVRSAKPRIQPNSYSMVTIAAEFPSFSQLGGVRFPSLLSALEDVLKPIMTTKPSPPRSVAPVFPRGVVYRIKNSNELLNREVCILQNQLKSLEKKSGFQEEEMHKAMMMKCIIDQLKEVMEKLPSDMSELEAFRFINDEIESLLNKLRPQEPEEMLPYLTDQASSFGESAEKTKNNIVDISETANEYNLESSSDIRESVLGSPKLERVVIEQFEPGVYVTLLQLTNGIKMFKRVRFSKRRFDIHQAIEWWCQNKDRLLSECAPEKASSAASESSETPPALPVENNEAE